MDSGTAEHQRRGRHSCAGNDGVQELGSLGIGVETSCCEVMASNQQLKAPYGENGERHQQLRMVPTYFEWTCSASERLP